MTPAEIAAAREEARKNIALSQAAGVRWIGVSNELAIALLDAFDALEAERKRVALSDADGRAILARWLLHFGEHALACRDKTLTRDTRAWMDAAALTRTQGGT